MMDEFKPTFVSRYLKLSAIVADPAEQRLSKVVPPLQLCGEAVGFTEDEVQSLREQAEALMTLYGVLFVYCGQYAFTLYHCDPKRLVEARLTYDWGIIGTTGSRALMKWGEPPEDAYEGWML